MINNGYYMPGVLGQYQTGNIPAPAQIKNIIPPAGGYQQTAPAPVSEGLGLCQVNGFQMVRQFKDAAGVEWALRKSAEDSSVDIPDPAYVQVTDFWNHVVPGTNNKVYIYVVEGIKRPRTTSERPVKILYQWFSEYNNPTFTPQMITPAEWSAANVFTSAIGDARVSKLKALCGLKDEPVKQDTQQKKVKNIDMDKFKGINNGNTTSGK